MDPRVNESAYLLSVLTEEASEVVKEICIGVNLSSKEVNDFYQESFELIAVADMLRDMDILDNDLDFVSIRNISELNLELLNLMYFVSKSIRFSLNDKHPELKETNKIYLSKIILAIEEFIIKNSSFSLSIIDSIKRGKIEKVKKYMKYSEEIGTLIKI